MKKTLQQLYDDVYRGKFWLHVPRAALPGVPEDAQRLNIRVPAYFVDVGLPIIKIDGMHYYFWYRDPRLEPEVELL